jgi:NAD(P)-dependent dehydrogenase (short-subunit alcohol dehydrogenase family)
MTTQQHVSIVTGGARGIGAAIAERLAGDGQAVCIADIDAEAADAEARRLLERGAQAMACQVDVSEFASASDMARSVVKRFGRIDALVNNAGVTGPALPLVDYPDDAWRRVLSVDLDGVFNCCKAVLPQMQAQRRGWIVNIASIAGKEGNPNMCAYSAAKAAVIGLTKSLGKELATSGIVVNCVTPAVIETELLRELTPEAVQFMVQRVPMGRTGKVEEVAAMVAWLTSEQCSFSTGAVFDVSGGRATY